MTDGARLLADEMLGKLARELRVLGFDVAYARDMEDAAILERAVREERTLVTRDVQLAAQAGEQAILLRSREPNEQLEHVIEALGLDPSPADFLSRCIECNIRLERTQAGDVVPADVRGQPHWCCPGCDRVYWRGTHTDDMIDRLSYLVDAAPGELRPGHPDADQNP